MPNRIIKDTIRISKSINSLSDFQFRTWTYLITYVDDYGRGSADPELLKGFLFPRRKGVTEQQISKVLADLATIGMITLYEVDGESFLCFPNWDKHQRIQTKKSKFPAPEESTVSHGYPPPESNPNPNTESKEESSLRSDSSCTEPKIDSVPPAILLPLNDGTDYAVSQDQRQEWEELYPAVDVMQQLRNMRGWLSSNPEKRKTRRGVLRFITSWLAREQDKGGSTKRGPTMIPRRYPTGSAGTGPLGDLERETLERMMRE